MRTPTSRPTTLTMTLGALATALLLAGPACTEDDGAAEEHDADSARRGDDAGGFERDARSRDGSSTDARTGRDAASRDVDLSDLERPQDVERPDRDTSNGGDTEGFTEAADVASHVIVVLAVASRGEGFDLDGDGSVDNALAPLKRTIDPLLDDALASAERAIVVQISGVTDLSAEGEGALGLFSAADTDGDPSDNDSGSETFDGGAGVDDEGRARVTSPVALAGGSYDGEISVASDTFDSLPFEVDEEVLIRGDVSAEAHDGMLGAAIPIDRLAEALTASGNADAADRLSMLADLDLDGDGSDDAISVALAFDAVGCVVTP